MKKVSYQSGGYALNIEGGGEFRSDGGEQAYLASLDEARDVSLTSLRDALNRDAREFEHESSRLIIVDMPSSRLRDGTLIDPVEIIWEKGALWVTKDLICQGEPPADQDLLARLAGLAVDLAADEHSSERYWDDDQWVVTLKMRLRTRGRTVGDAVALANDAEAIAFTPVSDLDAARAARIVKAGHARVLVGSYETDWLDVKSAPYRDVRHEHIELSKDVAAFANSGGGLILIGLQTKNDGTGDRIIKVNECVLDDDAARRYRRTIQEHIYPRPEQVQISSVPGSDPHQGVMMIEVPAQPARLKPFLVRGVLVGDRVAGAYFALPTRRGGDAEHVDIRIIHSRLQAGQRYLEGGVDSTSGNNLDLRGRLDALEDLTVPDFLGDLVTAARTDGFVIERAGDSIVFRRGGGSPIVVSTVASGPLADLAARESLLAQLAQQGLAAKHTPKGFLRPAS